MKNKETILKSSVTQKDPHSNKELIGFKTVEILEYGHGINGEQYDYVTDYIPIFKEEEEER